VLHEKSAGNNKKMRTEDLGGKIKNFSVDFFEKGQ
jgi:hypothetical protein